MRVVFNLQVNIFVRKNLLYTLECGLIFIVCKFFVGIFDIGVLYAVGLLLNLYEK
jgi:hypothetical protein